MCVCLCVHIFLCHLGRALIITFAVYKINCLMTSMNGNLLFYENQCLNALLIGQSITALTL